MSSGDRRVHFGAETSAGLEIRWPSGIVQRLEAVGIDRILQVKEPLQ